MIKYIQSYDHTRVPSLSLVVVAGVLESMVDATPASTGHTFLRRLYDTICAINHQHITRLATDMTPPLLYHTVRGRINTGGRKFWSRMRVIQYESLEPLAGIGIPLFPSFDTPETVNQQTRGKQHSLKNTRTR
jgi:hypothetical protein